MKQEFQMQMEVPEHSPLPWFVDDTTIYYHVQRDSYDSEPAVAECGPDTDATAWVDKESDDPKLTRRANAQFIVRAVNNHDTLIAEVIELRRMLNQFAPLVFTKEVIPHLPGNLEDETKAWLRGTRTEDVLSAAQEQSHD